MKVIRVPGLFPSWGRGRVQFNKFNEFNKRAEEIRLMTKIDDL